VTIIVDASVALKWVVKEAGSSEARELMTETLAAPELLYVECANALWAMARRKQFSAAEAAAAFAAIEGAPIRSISTRAHANIAQIIAFDLDQPVYDCLYLAAALAEHATFVTADAAFYRAASANAAYRAAVRPLTP
jgi:predicted nucleic acid-binding protein